MTLAVQGNGDADAARALTLRRGRTASIELHQFTDRVFAANPAWAQGDTLGKLRSWLADSHMVRINGKPSNDLSILHDVADAFKHAERGHPRPGRDWFVKSDAAVVRSGTGYGRLENGE